MHIFLNSIWIYEIMPLFYKSYNKVTEIRGKQYQMHTCDKWVQCNHFLLFLETFSPSAAFSIYLQCKYCHSYNTQFEHCVTKFSIKINSAKSLPILLFSNRQNYRTPHYMYIYTCYSNHFPHLQRSLQCKYCYLCAVWQTVIIIINILSLYIQSHSLTCMPLP